MIKNGDRVRYSGAPPPPHGETGRVKQLGSAIAQVGWDDGTTTHVAVADLKKISED